jgi:Arc/MetJ-type ribon-helix-helix transcriptional regulator
MVYTNRAAHWRGDTVVVTVRLPRPVVEFMDNHFSDDLRNRSEVLQHATAQWAMLSEMEEADGLAPGTT